MTLSVAEKAAGLAFRNREIASLAALNEAQPPDSVCSPYGPPYFRHECGDRKGTVAMVLKERTAASPELPLVPAGRFSWTYQEGTCKACGFTVRSGSGYLAVNEEGG